MTETKPIDIDQLLNAKRMLDEKEIPTHVVILSNPEGPNWIRRLFFGEDE